MKNFAQKISFNAGLWFGIFILLHILLWTIAPALSRHTLPIDALEGANWGQHLAFGYDKDPFMNAWLTHLALIIGGQSGWCVYLFSALAAAISMIAVWALARAFLPAPYAFVAATILEGIQYYNIATIDFDDNSLQTVFWGLSILFFYKALKYNRWQDWIWLGMAAGLGLMSKYFILILFLAMLLFLIFTNRGLRTLATPKPYISIFIFLIIITPHLIWLTQNHYATIHYGINRTTSDFHTISAWGFTQIQLQALMPCVLLFIALCVGSNKYALDLSTQKPSGFDAAYVIFIGIAPFIITIVASLGLQLRLHNNWAYSMTMLWPLIVIVVFKPTLTNIKLWRYAVLLFTLMCIAAILYASLEIRGGHKKDGNFPAQRIARKLTQAWQDHYHTPLAYVAGPRTVSGMVALYSQNQPSVLFDYDPSASPWVNMRDFYQKGALVILASSYANFSKLPQKIVSQIPCLSQPMQLHLPWHHDDSPIKATITFAFIHPKCQGN